MTDPTTTTMESVLLHDVHEHQECSQTTHEKSTTDNFSGLDDQPTLQNGSSRSTLEELDDLKAKVAALTARLDEMAGDNEGVTQSGVEEDAMSEKSAVKDSDEEDPSEGEDSEEEGSGEEDSDGEYTPGTLRLEIKRLSMDTWSTYNQNLLRKEVSRNVLIVYQKSVTRRDLGTKDVLDADSQDGWSEERIQHIPQRLQINSGVLLYALKPNTDAPMPPPPWVMVPPFKAVIGSHDKIQKALERKEAAISKYQQQRDENSASIGLATLDKARIEQKLEYQRRAVDHLRCLLQFIEVDLKETLELRSKIKDGTLEKISFSNLWHLFTHGDVIFPNAEMLGRSMKDYSYPRAFVLWSVARGRPTMLPERLKKEEHPFELGMDMEDGPRATNGLLEGPCKPFSLNFYGVGYDGECLSPEGFEYDIEEYRGEKHITDLPFYPARFCHRYTQIYQVLIKRGEHYVQLLTDCYNEYQGLTMGEDPEEVEGGVVTDSKTGHSMDRRDFKIRRSAFSGEHLRGHEKEWKECAIKGGSSYNDQEFEDGSFDRSGLLEPINPGDPTKMQNITEKHYLLLGKAILGFVLRIRKWKYLDVDLVRKPEESNEGGTTAFDELVIKESYKKTILALIQSHFAGPESLKQRIQQGESLSMDVVKGKGRGLVILLHGAPGVGKTSTAETVAAHTKRPLYPITCGDLGMTAGEVEKALDTHFQLAHKWGCVLLLDEADVFLARRQAGDVKRNALVSVFLRTLEYYSGILILTTNRVGEIDEAFHSRIKMSFYYQPLNEKRTIQIWKNSLEKIKDTAKRNKEKGTIIKIDHDERDEILKFARDHFNEHSKDKKKQPWNGRQIRNAFQTALALADYDRLEELERKIEKGKITLSDIEAKPKYRTVKLKVKHFRQVAKVTADYHKYVTTMQKGKTNETLAAMHQLRANDSELDAPENQRAIQQAEGSSKGKQRANKAKEFRVPTPVSRSETDSEKADTDTDGGDDDDDGNDDTESSDESDH